MQFKDRIQVIWTRSSIAIRFELTKGFIKSSNTKPEYAQYMFQKMVHSKILAMVKQRRFQVASQLVPSNQVVEQAIINAMAKLTYMPNWGSKKWRSSLIALLPNLKEMAPANGKFVQAWDSLFDAIETILQVEDLSTELNNCIYA